MHASFLRHWQSAPSRLNAVAWLAAFVSPTMCFVLLLLLVDRFQVPPLPPPLPEVVVVTLLFLVPTMALLVCEAAVWRSRMTVAWKTGGMVFTLLAMSLQFGVLMIVLRAILVTRIGYAQ